MVTLKGLRLENFLNVTAAEIPLKDQGFVLIVGENGCGKSAIFTEGPFYGLYGESFRYGPRPGREVIKTGAKRFLCQLDVHVEGVGDVSIRRAKGQKSKDYPDGLSVWIDGRNCARGSDAETQKWLNELYAMGSKTFVNSVLFTRDTLQFPLLPDSKKKEILDDLLRLDSLEVARKAGEVARKELSGAQTTLENRIEVHEERIPELEEHAEKLRVEDKAWIKTHERAVKAAATEVTEAVSATGVVSELVDSSRATLSRAQSESASLQKQIETARESLRVAREKFIRTQTTIQSKVTAQKSVVTDLKNQIESKETLLGRPCPKCGQAVGTSVEEWVENKKSEQAKATGVLEELKQELSALKADEDKLDEANEDITEFTGKCRDAQTAVSKASQTHDKHVRALGAAEGEEKAARERHATAVSATNHIKPQLEEAEGRIEKLKTKLTEERAQLTIVSEKLEVEKIFDQTFGPKGARLLLLDMVVPNLNAEALRLCSILRTAMNVTFAVRGDEQSYAGTFEVNVDNPVGAPDYRGDSSGERRRIDLVLLFSLLRLAGSRGAKSFNQAIFDEPFENLDEAGQEGVLALLAQEAKEKSSTFVITHSAFEMTGDASRVWRVHKNGEISFTG